MGHHGGPPPLFHPGLSCGLHAAQIRDRLRGMGRPKDLSEFSYGYALTEALINAAPSSLKAAPYFPSLIKEGKKGGGYDVKITFSGELLYLQFKLADEMVSRSAVEAQKKLFKTPFFRMPLRSSTKSDQHRMLIELEESGEKVFYAAPKFSTAKGLDEAYLARRLIQQTCFFRPSKIGPLPDQKQHWVAFKPPSPIAYFCSKEPKKLNDAAILDGQSFLDNLLSFEPREVTPEVLRGTANRMREIILKELMYGPLRRRFAVKNYREKSYEELRSELTTRVGKKREEQEEGFEAAEDVAQSFQRLEQEREPTEQVAYLARTFFGCEVLRLEKD